MATRVGKWIAVLAVCVVAAGATLAYAFNSGNGVEDEGPSTWLEFNMSSVTPETCDGFDTRTEAQRFFDSHQGPEHKVQKLDPDGDGQVCEEFAFGAR